jgi:chitin disaccharide deacetylase
MPTDPLASRRRLLIIHADDLGLAHSVNEATFLALETGCISSASVMIPCPTLPEVAACLRSHPEFDIGIHLTLTSEWSSYRWGPVAPKSRVPSLLDSSGYFWTDSKLAVPRCKVEEVEYELRAQVERALELGIHPTHLDTHMLMLFETPKLFLSLVKVAREYKLPFLAVRIAEAPEEVRVAIHEQDIVLDYLLRVHKTVAPDEWATWYAQAVTGLEPGLTQLTVHLGYDNAELRALAGDRTDFGSAWRQRDLQVVSSTEFRELILQKEIKVVDWKGLQEGIRPSAPACDNA